MATITQEIRLELAKRELVAFLKARGQTLSCIAGELWITVDGEAADVILRGGETWHIASDARVIVSALQPSQVILHCSRLGRSHGGRAALADCAALRGVPAARGNPRAADPPKGTAP